MEGSEHDAEPKSRPSFAGLFSVVDEVSQNLPPDQPHTQESLRPSEAYESAGNLPPDQPHTEVSHTNTNAYGSSGNLPPDQPNTRESFNASEAYESTHNSLFCVEETHKIIEFSLATSGVRTPAEAGIDTENFVAMTEDEKLKEKSAEMTLQQFQDESFFSAIPLCVTSRVEEVAVQLPANSSSKITTNEEEEHSSSPIQKILSLSTNCSSDSVEVQASEEVSKVENTVSVQTFPSSTSTNMGTTASHHRMGVGDHQLALASSSRPSAGFPLSSNERFSRFSAFEDVFSASSALQDNRGAHNTNELVSTPEKLRVSVMSPTLAARFSILTPPSQTKSLSSVLYSQSLSLAKETPKSRMIIDQLIIENFKSYGGRKVIGPFHKRFSAIMGPNGSGKSNIIDALQFVFGRRAKKIRLKKVSDLIHHSRLLDRKTHRSAKVTVLMKDILDAPDGGEGFECVEGSEIVLSREVFLEDDRSEYRINGQRKHHADVVKILGDRGIDLVHNRFLILQGEVEQIALMKPKATRAEEEGLLEYLEDIIGTNKYKEAIEEAREGFEAVDELCSRAQHQCQAAQQELEKLKEPFDEAAEYVNISKAVLKLKLLHLHRDLQDKKSRLDEASAALQEISLDMEGDEQKLKELTHNKEELSDVLHGEERRLSYLQETYAQEDAKFKAKEQEDEAIRAIIADELNKLEAKTKEFKALELERPLKLEEAQNKAAKAADLEQQLPSAVEESEEAEKEYEVLKDGITGELKMLGAAMARAEKKLAPLQENVDKEAKKCGVAETELNLLRSKLSERLEAMRRQEKNLSESTSSVETNSKALILSEASLEKENLQLKKVEEEIANTKEEIAHTQSSLRHSNNELDKMKNQSEKAKTNSEALNFIMNGVRSGQFKGIHGILSELGDIDPKYEAAWIAAAGWSSNSLIVETPGEASEIFKRLRERDLGRITCFAIQIMDRNERQNMEKGDATLRHKYGNAIRLIDLIKPKKPEYRICFYYAVKDTFVCNTLQEATSLGFGNRVRVVSINGELIEPDGRMTAGGTEVKCGKTLGQQLISTDDSNTQKIQQIEEEVKFRAVKLKEARKAEEALHIEQDQLHSQIRGLTLEVNIRRQNLSSAQAQQKIAKDALSTLRAASNNDSQEAKIKGLEDEIAEITKQKKHFLKLVAQQEKEVNRCRSALDNAGGNPVKEAKRRAMVAEANVNKIRESIDRFKVDSSAASADSEKMKRAMKKLVKEIEEHKTNQETLYQSVLEIENQARDIEDLIVNLQELLTQQKMGVAAAKERFAVIDHEFQAIKINAIDKQHKHQKQKEEINVLKTKISAYEQKIRETHDEINSLPELNFLLEDAEENPSEAQRMGYNENVQENVDSSTSENQERVFAAARDSPPGVKEEGENLFSKDFNVKEEIFDEIEESSSSRNRNCQATSSLIDFNSFDEDQAISLCSSKTIDFMLQNILLFEKKKLQQLIETLQGRLQKQKPNMAIIEHFRRRDKELKQKKEMLEKEQKSRLLAREKYEKLSQDRRQDFQEGFNLIGAHLKNIYQMITLGGDADLEAVDATDFFSEGIRLSVRPPKKSWKEIQHLSGGEKTLSSLALVFALHHYKPTPIYFMDEIDAALDFRNVAIIARYILGKTIDAQFIVVSLRNQMFEHAHRMVGIYKTHDVTKSVSISPSLFCLEEAEEGEERGSDATRGRLQAITS